MFSNPFYKGEFSYHQRVLPGKHQALVTADEFRQAQLILDRGMDRRSRKHNFAFSGLLRCGKCGCQIVAEKKVKSYRKTNRTVTYVYYHCTNGKGGCSKHGISETLLCEHFVRAFDKIKIPATFAEWAMSLARQLAKDECGTDARATANLKKLCGRQLQRLEKLDLLRLDDEISSTEYATLKFKLESEVHSIEQSIDSYQTEEQSVLRLIEQKLNLAVQANGFSKASDAERRGLIQALGAPHYLTLGTIRISTHPIVKALATIGPRISRSVIHYSSQLKPPIPAWSTYLNTIRTLAREEVRRDRTKSA